MSLVWDWLKVPYPHIEPQIALNVALPYQTARSISLYVCIIDKAASRT